MKYRHYLCPVGDMGCPYYATKGKVQDPFERAGDCLMVTRENCNPLQECDDAYYYDPQGDNWYYEEACDHEN